MSTNMQQPAPTETVTDPVFQKASDQVSQGLAVMAKAIHKAAPDSPLGDALVQMQKLVAEVETQYEAGPPPAEEGVPEEGVDPMAEEGLDPATMEPPMAAEEQDPAAAPIEEAAAPAPSSGNPMFDASAGLHEEMLASEDPKKRRR
jgi:hypothetical protein